MAIFKRRKNQTVAELEEYYATKKARSGMAWIMALLSLLITVLVVSGLFFGGRWVYRALTDDSIEVTVSNTDMNEQQTKESAGDNNQSGDNYFPNVVTDEAASTNTPSTPNSPSTPSTPNTNGTSTSTAPTGVDNNLPNTGAGEILIVTPLVAMVVGYLISRKYHLSQYSK